MASSVEVKTRKAVWASCVAALRPQTSTYSGGPKPWRTCEPGVEVHLGAAPLGLARLGVAPLRSSWRSIMPGCRVAGGFLLCFFLCSICCLL